MKKLLIILLAICSITAVDAQKKKKKKGKKKGKVSLTQRIPLTLTTSPDSEKRLNLWFKDAKYGAFIHFGPYSALEGAYKGKGQQHHYAEWIMMSAKIPADEYHKEVAAKFNPSEFDAEEWVKPFKSVGLKYVVLTSKHHDGFALFDSDVNDYNIVDYTKFKRDIVGELADACKKHGIHFGLYYSHAQDWDEPNATLAKDDVPLSEIHNNLPAGFKPNMESYLRKKALPQVEELVKKYPVELIWFDTPVGITEAYAKEFSDLVRKYRPNCVINSRLLKKSSEVQQQSYQQYYDYISLGDKQVPNTPLSVSFDSPDSVSKSYGYKTKGKIKYHSLKELIHRFVNTVCSGGNYLLNNGPMGNGKLNPKAIELYKGIGDWLAINGASIYDTRKNPFKKPSWGNISMNEKKKVYYLHILEWPSTNKITLSGFDKEVKKVSFLANGKEVKFNKEGKKLVVNLLNKNTDSYDVVVKVEVK